MLKRVLVSTCVMFFAASHISVNAKDNLKKLFDGLLITLKHNSQQNPYRLKLEILLGKVIHVAPLPKTNSRLFIIYGY
jgi:hypothetical protein